MLKPMLKPISLAVLLASCSVALAADIDILDKQRKEAPAPKSLPSLEIVDDAAKTGNDLSQRFILGSLQVEGVTVFSAAELTAPYQSLYGTETSFQHIRSIADELTRKYRDAGYLLSRVILPTQQGDPKNARVRLVAIEGYISAIEYQGEAELVERFKSYWLGVEQKLLALRPLKHTDFERELLILQDMPSLRVSSRFKEASVPGGSVLVLELTKKPFDLSASWGNTGTQSAGHGIATVTAGLNALPFIGAKTTISYSQANDRREYYSTQIAHSHQFSNGLIASASYAYSKSPEPDSEFARLFDYETRSKTFTAGLSYPFIRSRDINLSAGLSYEHRNSESDLIGARYTTDHLRDLILDVNFDFSDEWGGTTQIIPSLTRGLNWYDATDRDPNASTPIAPAVFTKGKLYLSRNQSLSHDFSLFAAAEAQYSDSPLSSYNRYSLGGNQFGRGYDPGIIENDKGLAASLEGRWNGNLSGHTVQPFIFIDWGKTWADKRLNGSLQKEYLASAGIGARLMGNLPGTTPLRFSLTAFVGKPQRAVSDARTSDERYMLQGVLSF
ncbi:hypothetical protein AGMMS50256_13670 [Betaproteobacteria bacterium]|nr:hypothetical protein AGMMS50256_13670 [Betaproteobacteria bacterium]